MSKNFIKITDDKGVEHTFYNFTNLVEYIDSFTMSFLPDDFTYFIQEESDELSKVLIERGYGEVYEWYSIDQWIERVRDIGMIILKLAYSFV